MREIENALAWLGPENLEQIEYRWWKLEASHIPYPLFVDRDALEELQEGLEPYEDDSAGAEAFYENWLDAAEGSCDREYRTIYSKR